MFRRLKELLLGTAPSRSPELAEAKTLAKAVEHEIEGLSQDTREVRKELEHLKTKAEEKGTDPLAELVRSMQRGRRKRGERRDGFAH